MKISTLLFFMTFLFFSNIKLNAMPGTSSYMNMPGWPNLSLEKKTLKKKIKSFIVKHSPRFSSRQDVKSHKLGFTSFLFGILSIGTLLLAVTGLIPALTAFSITPGFALISLLIGKYVRKKDPTDRFAKAGILLSTISVLSILAVVIVVLIAFASNGK